jgi:uncharacterized SAM-binding protein YcdF (DUF218 family)
MTYLHPVLPVLLLFALASLVARRSAAWKWIRAASIAGIFLWAWSPAAWLASRTLERNYRPGRPAGAADAIVVLSDNTLWPDPSLPEPVLGEGTYTRCRYAAWLYRNGPALPILVTGIAPHFGSVAQVMKRELEGEGVPAGMIWTEDESTSTFENAAFSARILRRQRAGSILLVTEAYHMRRAELSFRKQGLTVIPAPCAFRTYRFRWKIAEVFPNATAIRENDDALHEWIGLLWYRIRGRI